MHPHRKEYPDDFVQYFHSRISRNLHDSARCHIVTVESKGTQEIINGYADWLRCDDGLEEPLRVSANAGQGDSTF